MRAPQNNLGRGSEAMSTSTNDNLDSPCAIRSQEQVDSSFKTHYDVIVVGGGAAGIGAAFGARQAGASVLLIEATGCLGGETIYKELVAVRADGYVYSHRGHDDALSGILLWDLHLCFSGQTSSVGRLGSYTLQTPGR